MMKEIVSYAWNNKKPRTGWTQRFIFSLTARDNWFPYTIFDSDLWKEARKQQIEPGIEYGGQSQGFS